MSLFNSRQCDGVSKGSCVMISKDGTLLYAGPIPKCPEVPEESLMLLHSEDFQCLAEFIKNSRH